MSERKAEPLVAIARIILDTDALRDWACEPGDDGVSLRERLRAAVEAHKPVTWEAAYGAAFAAEARRVADISYSMGSSSRHHPHHEIHTVAREDAEGIAVIAADVANAACNGLALLEDDDDE